VKLTTNLAELAGKTVLGAAETDYGVAVTFTDGVAVRIEPDVDEETCYASAVEGMLLAKSLPRETALTLGLCTAAEWAAFDAETRAAAALHQEQRERAEYQRLQAKFGGSPS
jgi:hypothetical protein